MKPKLSIITVCYNACHLLHATVKSVDSQHLDDFCKYDYEHLIIDGASTDCSLEMLRNEPNERRRVLSEKDDGIYDAMNKGLDRARADYVMFLNAGDTFHGSDALGRILSAIDEDHPGIIYGQTALVNDRREPIGERHLRAPELLSYDSFKDGMVVCHQAFIVLAKIAGQFNTNYSFSADYDWCVRCLQHSRINHYLGAEPLIDYLYEGATTRNRRASLMERFRIMRYYYGLFPTIARHISFVLRLLKSKKGKARN